MAGIASASAGHSKSPPKDTIGAALEYLRQVSADRLREPEMRGARSRLRQTLQTSCLTPLWQQVDMETNPQKRILRVALADYVGEYIRLLTLPPNRPDSGESSDPVNQRLRLTNAILKLQKELQDDFGRL